MQEGGTMPHLFDPANRHRLLSEERYRTSPPDKILDQLPLRPAATVADIGCGPGFFTLPLAERVPQGTVYAIDVAQQMLDMVTERATAAGIGNIKTMLAGDSALDLPLASLDGALLGLVYHEFPNRVAYLRQLAALVRPGSWLALLDWMCARIRAVARPSHIVSRPIPPRRSWRRRAGGSPRARWRRSGFIC